MIQSEQYHMQPVVHNATKAKQMLIADVKRENTKMWELYQILGRKKRKIWHFLHLFWRAILVE